jgi:hypothetical protein
MTKKHGPSSCAQLGSQTLFDDDYWMIFNLMEQDPDSTEYKLDLKQIKTEDQQSTGNPRLGYERTRKIQHQNDSLL